MSLKNDLVKLNAVKLAAKKYKSGEWGSKTVLAFMLFLFNHNIKPDNNSESLFELDHVGPGEYSEIYINKNTIFNIKFDELIRDGVVKYYAIDKNNYKIQFALDEDTLVDLLKKEHLFPGFIERLIFSISVEKVAVKAVLHLIEKGINSGVKASSFSLFLDHLVKYVEGGFKDIIIDEKEAIEMGYANIESFRSALISAFNDVIKEVPVIAAKTSIINDGDNKKVILKILDFDFLKKIF